MWTLPVRFGAAVLFVLVPATFGAPVALDFDTTSFEATMGYNNNDPGTWPTTQSESIPPQPDDSLSIPNYDLWANLLFEVGTPIDQAWSVQAEQTYPGGSEYPTLHFTFTALYASPVVASFPLMIGLQNLNDVSMRAWTILEPVTGTFTYSGNTLDWTLSGGTVQSGGPGEYDLAFSFNNPENFGLPSAAQIDVIDIVFNVAPEPGTLALLATGLCACWRRRRR